MIIFGCGAVGFAIVLVLGFHHSRDIGSFLFLDDSNPALLDVGSTSIRYSILKAFGCQLLVWTLEAEQPIAALQLEFP